MKKRNLGRKGLAILLSLTIAMSMMPTAVFASSVNVADTANTIISGDGTLAGGTVITNEDGSQTIIPSSSDSDLSDGDTADDNGKPIVNEDENGTDAVGSDSKVDADANDADAAGTDSDTGSGSAATATDEAGSTSADASTTPDSEATAPAGSTSAPTVGDMALDSVLDSALGDNAINAINDEIGLYADTDYEYGFTLQVCNKNGSPISEVWECNSSTPVTKTAKVNLSEESCLVKITYTGSKVASVAFMKNETETDAMVSGSNKTTTDAEGNTVSESSITFNKSGIAKFQASVIASVSGSIYTVAQLNLNLYIQEQPTWDGYIHKNDKTGSGVSDDINMVGSVTADYSLYKEYPIYGIYNIRENPQNLTIKYKSSNEDVATVDSDGGIYIKAPGIAKLTAYTEESGICLPSEKTLTLTVKADASNWTFFTKDSIDLNYAELPYNNKLSASSLKDEYGLQLVAAKYDQYGTQVLSYTSSDSELVSVDDSGNLTVKNKGKCGTATISAKVHPDASAQQYGCTVKTISYTVNIKNPGVLDFTNSNYKASRLTQLLSANGGSASYDSNTKKLTLQNINFTPEFEAGQGYAEVDENYYPAIVLPAGATVELQGENKISGDSAIYATEDYLGSSAIFTVDISKEDADASAYGDFTITGDGSLNIEGFNIGMYAIYVNTLIKGGKVTITQPSQSGTANAGIVVGGKLKIDGGDLKLVKKETSGVSPTIAIEAERIDVSAGTLTVDHTVYKGEISSEGVINCSQGFSISGGKADIDVKANDETTALYLYEKDLNVSGGELSIKISGEAEDAGPLYGIRGKNNKKANINVTGGKLKVDSTTDYPDDRSAYCISDVENISLSGGLTLLNSNADNVFDDVNKVDVSKIKSAKYSATYNGANYGGGSNFTSSTDWKNEDIRSFKATNLGDKWYNDADLSTIELFYSQCDDDGNCSIELDLGDYDGAVKLSSSDESLFTVSNTWDKDSKKNTAVIKLNASATDKKTGTATLTIEAADTANSEGKTLERNVKIIPMVRYGFGDSVARANAFLTRNGTKGTANWDENTKTLTINGILQSGCVILPSGATLNIEGDNKISVAQGYSSRTQHGVVGIGDLTVQGTGKLELLYSGSMFAGGNLLINGGELVVPTLGVITSDIAKDKNVLVGLFKAGDLSYVDFANNSSHNLIINGGTITVESRVYAKDAFKINGGIFTLDKEDNTSRFSSYGEYKSASPELGDGVVAVYGNTSDDVNMNLYSDANKNEIYDYAYFQSTGNNITLSNILGENPTTTVSYCDASVSTVIELPEDWDTYRDVDALSYFSYQILQGGNIVKDTEPKFETISVKEYDENGDISYVNKRVLTFDLNDDCNLGEVKVKVKIINNKKYANAEAVWIFTVTGEADFTKNADRAIALINAANPDVEAGVVEIKTVLPEVGAEESTPGDPEEYVLFKGIQNFDAPIIVSGRGENGSLAGYGKIMLKGENTISELKGEFISIYEYSDEDGAHSLHTGNITANSVTLYGNVSLYVDGSIDANQIGLASFNEYTGSTILVKSDGTLFPKNAPGIRGAGQYVLIGEKTDGSDAVRVENFKSDNYDKDKHHYFKLTYGEDLSDVAFEEAVQTVFYCVNADGIIDIQALNGLPEDFPETAKNAISYSVSDSSLVTVTSEGKLQLNNTGKTGVVTVTAKLPAVDGKYQPTELSYKLWIYAYTADFEKSPERAKQLINAAQTGSGKASWDSDTKTLSLDNVSYAPELPKLPTELESIDSDEAEEILAQAQEGCAALIVMPAGSIKLKGTNTLTAAADTNSIICLKGDMQITGADDGGKTENVLKLVAGDNTTKQLPVDTGILLGGATTVDGVTVDVSGVSNNAVGAETAGTKLTVKSTAELSLALNRIDSYCTGGARAINAYVNLSVAGDMRVAAGTSVDKDGNHSLTVLAPNEDGDYNTALISTNKTYKVVKVFVPTENKLTITTSLGDKAIVDDVNHTISMQYYDMPEYELDGDNVKFIVTPKYGSATNVECIVDESEYESIGLVQIYNESDNEKKVFQFRDNRYKTLQRAHSYDVTFKQSGEWAYEDTEVTYTINILGTAKFTTDNDTINQRSVKLLQYSKFVGGDHENISWDKDSKTLTLDGADYTIKTGNAIELPAGATIVVKGENRIKTGSGFREGDSPTWTLPGDFDRAIHCEGALTIKGYSTDDKLDLEGYVAIHLATNSIDPLKIENVTVNAIGHCQAKDGNFGTIKTQYSSGSLELKNAALNLTSEENGIVLRNLKKGIKFDADEIYVETSNDDKTWTKYETKDGYTINAKYLRATVKKAATSTDIFELDGAVDGVLTKPYDPNGVSASVKVKDSSDWGGTIADNVTKVEYIPVASYNEGSFAADDIVDVNDLEVGTQYYVLVTTTTTNGYKAIERDKVDGIFIITKAEYSGLSFGDTNDIYYNSTNTEFTNAVKGSLNDAKLTYAVTKGDDIVSVDSNGKVTVNSVGKSGEVIITATQEATDCYEEATASYTFNVLGVAYFSSGISQEQIDRSLQLLQYEGGRLDTRDENKASWDSATNTLTINNLTYSVNKGAAIKLGGGTLKVSGRNNISSVDYYAIDIVATNAAIKGASEESTTDVLEIKSENGYGIQGKNNLTFNDLTLDMNVGNYAFGNGDGQEGNITLDNAALTVKVTKKIRSNGIKAFNYNEAELYAVWAGNKEGEGATSFPNGAQPDSNEAENSGVKYIKTTVKKAATSEYVFSTSDDTEQVYNPDGNTVVVTKSAEYDYDTYEIGYIRHDANNQPIKGGDGKYVTNPTAKGVGTYSVWVSAPYTNNCKAFEGIIATLTVTSAELKVDELNYTADKDSLSYDGNSHFASDFGIAVTPSGNTSTGANKYVNKSNGSFTIGFKADGENASVQTSIKDAGTYTVWVKRVDSNAADDNDCYSGLENWTQISGKTVTITKEQPTLTISVNKKNVKYCESLDGIKVTPKASNTAKATTYACQLVEDSPHGNATSAEQILTIDSSGNVKINENGYFGTVKITAAQAADENREEVISNEITFTVEGQADFRLESRYDKRALKLINANTTGENSKAEWDADSKTLTLTNVTFNTNGASGIIADEDAVLKVIGTNSVDTNGTVTLQGFKTISGVDAEGKLASLNITTSGDDTEAWWIKQDAAIKDVNLTIRGKSAVKAITANAKNLTIDGAVVDLSGTEKLAGESTKFKGFKLNENVKATVSVDGMNYIDYTGSETWTDVKGFKTELKYLLTVNANPTEGGTVSVSGDTAYKAKDESITLTAKPNPGYTLTGWTVKDVDGTDVMGVADNDSKTFRFTMPEKAVTATAKFTANSYNITVDTITNGRVTVADSKTTAKVGETVSFTVTPGDKYQIETVSVIANTDSKAVSVEKNSDGNYSFEMPADSVKISATFAQDNFDITVSESLNGTVSSSHESAKKDTEITLTVIPAEGYELGELKVMNGDTPVTATEGVNNKYTFTMPAGNVTVRATFAQEDYTVTVNDSANGRVTANPNTAKVGATVTLTVTLDRGYKLGTLTYVKEGAGNSVNIEGTNGAYTFDMPAGNVTVSATFVEEGYAVTVNDSVNGKVIANPTTAKMNETVTLTVTPNAGYEIDRLTVSGEETIGTTRGEGNTYTFKMPAESVSVSATFKAIGYMVTTDSEHGSVEATPNKNVTVGKDVTVAISADEGYRLSSLTVDGEDVTRSVTENGYSFKMPAKNVEVKATFEAIDYTVTVNSTTNGTVTANRTSEVHIDETVTLTVTPESGYKLGALTVKSGDTPVIATTGANNTYTFKMPAGDVTVNATFEEAYYDINILTTGEGTVKAAPQTAKMNEKVTITVEPKEGYKLTSLALTDGENAISFTPAVSDNVYTYTFDMPASKVTIIATFAIKTYIVNFDANGGMGTMNPATNVVGEYTLPENGFTAPTDMKFKGWATSANGEVLSGKTITVTDNMKLYAIWEEKELEPQNGDITGTIESFDTDLSNAVIRIYSVNCDDATIRSDMRGDRSQAIAAYTDNLTLGTELLSGSKSGTYKQSFEIKDVAPGEYKLAVYKAKRNGKDPYVVSVVKITIEYKGTVTFEGNDSNVKMWLYGDVTWDGTINASDAEQVLRYATPGRKSKIIGKDTSCEGANQFVAADITGDGSLNASDAEQILRYATPGKTSKKFEEIEN